MSRTSIYNPSPLATLHLSIKTPCPRCPMFQSKQALFIASKTQPLSQMSRTQPLCMGAIDRAQKVANEKLMSQCPMCQNNRTAFKFQINQMVFESEDNHSIAHVPAVPSPKSTGRHSNSKTGQIKTASILYQQPYRV